ncbi:MAG: hypothetical protein ABIS92_00060 [Polyangia bacterium]
MSSIETTPNIRFLKLHLGMSLALVAAAACGSNDEADEFRAGVPQHEDVALAFPGTEAASGALTASSSDPTPTPAPTRAALLQEKAEMYQLTRGITVTVNAATVATLALVRTITEFPPSSVTADGAVWGPHTQALSPNTWRLTVTRESRGHFAYVLEAKDKTASDAGYLVVLSGHHVVADPTARRLLRRPAYGHGDFILDWDAAQRLPEHDRNVGKAAFVYSRPSPTVQVDIGVTFTQIRDDDTGMLVDATYAYAETPGSGGSFQFSVIKDAIATSAALETVSVRSRWLQTGAGRSDVKLTGGDLGAAQATAQPTAQATASECWDASFLSTYRTNSYGDAAKIWGAEPACAFMPADYYDVP